MDNKAASIPFNEGVKKIGCNEGEDFNFPGVNFKWKVKGEDSGFAFSFSEMNLKPGEGVSLHCHAYAEAFYVVSGDLDFLKYRDGQGEWMRASGGDTIIVPINALHAFYNRTKQDVRLLSISGQLHQAFFDAVMQPDRETPFSSIAAPEAMARVGRIAARHDMHFFPFTPPEPAKAARGEL